MDLEQTEPQTEGAAAAAPKNRKTLLIVVAAAGIVLMFGALGAYLSGVFASSEPQSGDEANAEEVVETVNKTVTLDPLVIQLSDKGRKPRFVRLSLTLGIYRVPDDDGKVSDLPADPFFKPRLQDRLIFAVGAKTSQELGTPEGREALKVELLREISQVFPEQWGSVLEIYITELLIQ